jgi:SulP family sulfate permease
MPLRFRKWSAASVKRYITFRRDAIPGLTTTANLWAITAVKPIERRIFLTAALVCTPHPNSAIEMITPSRDLVSFNPLPRLSAAVRTRNWRGDAIAGLTAAVFVVPQGMAYAVLAGLPPVTGLYAAIVMSIVAALWGSSIFLNTGPTTTAALLTAAALAPVLGTGLASPAAALFALGLLAGVFRTAMGLLRLGWLIKFVPEPAFVGFIAAAELLIAFGQLDHLLGVAPSHAGLAPLKILDVLSRAPQGDWRAVALALGVCVVMLISTLFSKKIPFALFAIVLASLAAPLLETLFPGTKTIALVRDISPIPAGLPAPHFYFPSLETWWALTPGALAIAVIGLIEAISVGRNLALKHNTELNFNQEFFGQGLAQTANACFGGVPGSASFTRTALLESCGGTTPLGNIFFGVFTALMLLSFPHLLERVPLAALAGLLFYTGLRIFEYQAIARVWRTSRSDFVVLALTFLVTFSGKVEWGFFVGIIAAMAIFLSRARDLQLFELVPYTAKAQAGSTPNARDTRFLEVPYSPDSTHEPSDVVALALHGDLFFGLAHELREQLAEIVRVQRPRFLVLRTRRAHSIDYSCWKALFDFAELFQENGGTLILTGVREDLRAVISDAGMKEILPPENIVAPTNSAWAAFEGGLVRVAARLDENAKLSAAWQDYFLRRHQRACETHSLSNWRDPYNDTATLGVVET